MARLGLPRYVAAVVARRRTFAILRVWWCPGPILLAVTAGACAPWSDGWAMSWDTHGANQAGLVTGWVSRLEHRFPPVFTPPDVTGPDLVTVVDGLLRLPAP